MRSKTKFNFFYKREHRSSTVSQENARTVTHIGNLTCLWDRKNFGDCKISWGIKTAVNVSMTSCWLWKSNIPKTVFLSADQRIRQRSKKRDRFELFETSYVLKTVWNRLITELKTSETYFLFLLWTSYVVQKMTLINENRKPKMYYWWAFFVQTDISRKKLSHERFLYISIHF